MDQLQSPAYSEQQFHAETMHDVIAMATDLARLVHRQAVAQAEAEPLAPLTHAANAYDKLARTIRKSILMARKVAEPIPDPAALRRTARQHIIRAVEDTIQREAEGEGADALHAEFLDRLDTLDSEDDFTTRPIVEIIADICRDLGLAHGPGHHPWKRRTPADVAALYARAATPRRAAPNPATPRPRPQATTGP